jgi:hypothetical protein
VIGAPVEARSGMVGTSTRGEPLRRALPGRLYRRPDSDRAAQPRRQNRSLGYASRTVRSRQWTEAAKKNQVERTI